MRQNTGDEVSGGKGGAAERHLPLFRPRAVQTRDYGKPLSFNYPRPRALAAVAGAAAIAFLLFDLAADFSRVELVRGVVVPAGGVSRLAAPRAGVVTAIRVRQGERVERGAALLRLSSNMLLPSGSAAPLERLAAFRRQQEIAREGVQTEATRAVAEGSRLDAQMAQAAASARSLDSQIAIQRERIARNEQRLRSLEPLRAKGFVSEITYQSQEENLLLLRQQLAEMEQRQSQAHSEFAQLRFRAEELKAESRRATLQSEAQLTELERGAADAQAEAEISLAAPVAGRIAAVHVSPGQTVAASQELASIVPNGGGLEIEILIPSTAIGLVRVGQQVTVRYDAFPYHRHGVGRGIIKSIASTVSPAPAEAAGTPVQRPVYRARVTLVSSRTSFVLQPDMTLSAGIILERRSLLEWVLTPLRERVRARQESGPR